MSCSSLILSVEYLLVPFHEEQRWVFSDSQSPTVGPFFLWSYSCSNLQLRLSSDGIRISESYLWGSDLKRMNDFPAYLQLLSLIKLNLQGNMLREKALPTAYLLLLPSSCPFFTTTHIFSGSQLYALSCVRLFAVTWIISSGSSVHGIPRAILSGKPFPTQDLPDPGIGNLHSLRSYIGRWRPRWWCRGNESLSDPGCTYGELWID